MGLVLIWRSNPSLYGSKIELFTQKMNVKSSENVVYRNGMVRQCLMEEEGLGLCLEERDGSSVQGKVRPGTQRATVLSLVEAQGSLRAW